MTCLLLLISRQRIGTLAMLIEVECMSESARMIDMKMAGTKMQINVIEI